MRNAQYSLTKRAVEEGIRFYGGNLEVAIPATLYLMSPITRNFTIRTINSFVKETARFKGRMIVETGRNLLKGGKPIGYTSSSGTGYIGRWSSRGKNFVATNPLTFATTAVVGIAALQTALMPEIQTPQYQSALSGQPSVASGGEKLIFGTW